MKLRIIVLMIALLAVGCNKDSSSSDLSHQAIIGCRYANSEYDIDIISSEQLVWTLSTNRDTATSYTISYTFADNKISFFIEDEIAYTSVTRDINDSFYGKFEGVNTLVGEKIIHNYADYRNDTYITFQGSTEIKGLSIPRTK